MILGRYFHTLRHLRPVQLYGRVWHRIYTPRPEFRPAPPIRAAGGRWQSPARRRPSLVRASRLRFLNVTRDIVGPGGWDNGSWPRLWRYNLHYFDDLNAEGAPERVDWHRGLIERWMAENPPALGTGWEPYPLSLRIVNWIKWALSGNALSEAACGSLATQVRFLRRRLEVHLLGNHLFANAKALLFAGTFFDGEEARSWRNKGLQILEREVPEQVLADGGHFERSPMYHSLIYEDLLDLVNLGQTFPKPFEKYLSQTDHWRETATRMGKWLEVMRHPDREIAFFNDSAFGVAPAPDELFRYAHSLGLEVPKATGEGIRALGESGYLRVSLGPWSVIFDGARVGPDYLPGHAHADTLSFELSFGEQRVVGNSGTSLYEEGGVRSWERSTTAHSTVTVDDEDSSEVWGSFRVARRARPSGLTHEESAGILRAACTHDGYRRLAGSPIHRRALELTPGEFQWEDELLGHGRHFVSGRVPIHPDIEVERRGEGWLLRLPGGESLLLRSLTGEALDIEQGTFAPEFGRVLPRPVIIWRVDAELPRRARFELSRR